MKNYLVLITVLLLCSSQQCGTEDICINGNTGLTFVNASDKKLAFEIYWNYPDTIIGKYNPSGNDPILPNSSFTRGAGRKSCWEVVLEDNRKEWIYIFDYDTIMDLPWETVRETNRGLLERRLIDLEYLRNSDFRVVYPLQ